MTNNIEIRDRFNRKIDRLRIKITHRCNYHCFFCHSEGSTEEKDLITVNDIEFIVRTLSNLGIRRFKITGGEPLLRQDIAEIINVIKKYNPIDISLTTNGYYLEEYAEELRKAGLDRLDVSLHTLDREKYIKMTGVDGLDKVLRGLVKASEVGFKQVKVNVLVTSVNIEDIPNILNFCKKIGLALQLIEYMPLGRGASLFKRYYIPLGIVYAYLRRKASKVLVRENLHRRPILIVDGVPVEFIFSFSGFEMCKYCTQVRLTSDLKLRGCIYRKDVVVDVLNAVKSQDVNEFIRRFFHLISYRSPRFTQVSQASFLSMSLQ